MGYAAPQPRETVVLVHGLWMRAWALLPMQYRLADAGFAARRFTYPSVFRGLSANAGSLAEFVAATPGDAVHLVCHSLGGLVALTMLARRPDPRIRRAVLMAAPVAGCHCAEALAATPALVAVIGASLREWLSSGPPAPPPGVEIGVIAGSRSLGLGRLIPGLPRPNDGAVAVAETRLAQARAMLIMDVNHSGMLVSAACARQVAAFLARGRFLDD